MVAFSLSNNLYRFVWAKDYLYQLIFVTTAVMKKYSMTQFQLARLQQGGKQGKVFKILWLKKLVSQLLKIMSENWKLFKVSPPFSTCVYLYMYCTVRVKLTKTESL